MFNTEKELEKPIEEVGTMTLSEFLLENDDVSNVVQEVAISPRFRDKKGNLLKFKIRAMTQDEFGSYQKACTRLDAKGKKADFDSSRFNLMVVENHCVDPDFKSVDFLKKAKVNTAKEAINRMLLAGEVVELGTQITKLSGFDTDLNEEIEEAKNY